jgi:hypothetical protein
MADINNSVLWIYCGSSSDFGKVSAPEPVPDQEIFRNFYKKKFFFIQKLAFSMLEKTLFPGKLASRLKFLYRVFHFMLDPDPNSVPEPECITVPVGQKVAVPAVPVPQYGTE